MSEPAEILTRPTDAQLDRWAEGSEDQRVTVMAAELRELRHLARVIDCIKKTGGAVEIHGVRIEPCDEYGETATTRNITETGRIAERLDADLLAARDRITALTSERDAAVRIARGNSHALDAAQAELRQWRPHPHDGDSDRSTGSAGGSNGGSDSSAPAWGER